MKYILKIKNPVTGRIEAYSTEAEDEHTLQMGIDFWVNDAGYEFVSAEPAPAPC